VTVGGARRAVAALLPVLFLLGACGGGDPVAAPENAAAPAPCPGMAPSGKTLHEILGVSSDMSRWVNDDWRRELVIQKLVEAGVTMVRNDFLVFRVGS